MGKIWMAKIGWVKPSGILKSKFNLKHVLSSHKYNNNVKRFHAHVVSLSIWTIAMLTSTIFSGASFTQPSFTNNAWTLQSILSTKSILHLFYVKQGIDILKVWISWKNPANIDFLLHKQHLIDHMIRKVHKL